MMENLTSIQWFYRPFENCLSTILPLKTFEHFPKLPLELRRKIVLGVSPHVLTKALEDVEQWQMADEEPCLVSILNESLIPSSLQRIA
jgi:hypothetical protein